MLINKLGKYSFLKFMSSNGMSTKENTLQLPPQFPSTSSSESEPETNADLIKIGKYIMYNNSNYTDFMKAIMILFFFYFYLLKLKHNEDSIIAWPRRFIFPGTS